MRLALAFLILLACTPPPPESPTVECPTCPPCVSCPPAKERVAEPCPACPKPDPEPEPEDWQCMDLERARRPLSGYCFPSASACEFNRKDVLARKVGKPGPCAGQREAYCFTITDPAAMNRQRMCARTMKNCRERRAYMAEHRPNPTDSITMCAPTRNTEEYRFRDEEPTDQTPAANAP